MKLKDWQLIFERFYWKHLPTKTTVGFSGDPATAYYRQIGKQSGRERRNITRRLICRDLPCLVGVKNEWIPEVIRTLNHYPLVKSVTYPRAALTHFALQGNQDAQAILKKLEARDGR